jgi:phosphatidylglycerophosphate synthase
LEHSNVALWPLGHNETKLWGITSAERLARIAGAEKLALENPDAASALLVDVRYAFDPLWLRHLVKHPGKVVTFGGLPAIAHVTGEADAKAVAAAMTEGAPLPPHLDVIAFEQGGQIYNEALRKLERPFMNRLEPSTVRSLERASYFGAYKGVTDALTKYLWPEWALVLTRLSARMGITPNMVTTIGAIFCVAATFAFYHGHYWLGMALGLGFMVLDTVDGKLARCTITSSWWGNVFDHGLDLVHPPFWWWAWGVGLSTWGLALSERTFFLVMLAIVGGYVVQRLIEGMFIRRFRMHIHVWEKLDSDFRLITARRNPNMVILFAFTLFGRPDLGLIALAWWTILSLIFHAARLMQAEARARGGEKIISWLG